MTHVLVLSGGTSDEREVSLRSGAAVSDALRQAGFQVSRLDPADLSASDSRLSPCDVVFPVLHGLGGEDGVLQAALQSRGIRYVGPDAAASALCFDKWRYKQVLQAANIGVPRGELVNADSFATSTITRGGPFVLKPYDGGSSVDTFIIRDYTSFDQVAVTAAFDRHPQMLLEALVSGIEITVGVLLGQALPVVEIVPPDGGEFDFENKYNGKTRELCPAVSLPADVQQAAQALAVRIARQLQVRDMSRTDMIVAPNGDLFVLETNTIPGMTTQSLFPKAAAAAGYDMPTMVSQLVAAALAREPVTTR